MSRGARRRGWETNQCPQLSFTERTGSPPCLSRTSESPEPTACHLIPRHRSTVGCNRTPNQAQHPLQTHGEATATIAAQDSLGSDRGGHQSSVPYPQQQEHETSTTSQWLRCLIQEQTAMQWSWNWNGAEYQETGQTQTCALTGEHAVYRGHGERLYENSLLKRWADWLSSKTTAECCHHKTLTTVRETVTEQDWKGDPVDLFLLIPETAQRMRHGLRQRRRRLQIQVNAPQHHIHVQTLEKSV